MIPKTFVPPGQMKKLLKANNDVGRTIKAVPPLLAYSVDVFMEELIKRALEIAAPQTEITMETLLELTHRYPEYDFLIPTITEANKEVSSNPQDVNT